MTSALSDILSHSLLVQMAGTRSYERGEDYFDRGRVQSLAEYEGMLTAQVQGAEDYQVQLWVADNDLNHRCTCPLGIDGIFCKHCVAVGLAWLANPSAVQSERGARTAQATVTMQDVKSYLEQQDRGALVQLILDQAMQDTDWREKLLMKAASSRTQGPDLNTFRRALSSAICTGDFIEYRELWGYAQRIESVVESIAELLKAGYANQVIELCEEAIPRLEEALGSVDDSDGCVGGVLEQVQQLHHQACQSARPDPEDLARRLFWWELNTSYDTFFGAVDTYADVLGEQGIAVYRQLASAEWQRLPALEPGQKGSYEHKRWRITQMMERLAKQSGDLEAVVAIKRRDLSQAYTYLEIAKLYQQAGQHDQALEWASQGLRAFPERPDYRLRDFLVEEYQRRGRFEDAMVLVWAEFTEFPQQRSYQKLQTQAERGNQWSEWREKALAHLHQQIAQSQSKKPQWGVARLDRSALVEIFLWEGDKEQAWQEAQAGGCSKQLWLRLASQRQSEHPEDALPLYQREVEPLIQQTNNESYAQAVRFLEKVRELMLRLGQQQEFGQLLAHLRQTYKAKRNFIKLLNQKQW